MTPLPSHLTTTNPYAYRTPEEIARRKELLENSELIGRKITETQTLIAKAQADTLKALTRKSIAMHELHREVEDHEKDMKDLSKLMSDPDADPDRIFGAFQKLSLEVTDSGITSRKQEEYLIKLENVSKSEEIVNLKEIAEAMESLTKQVSSTSIEVQEMIKNAPEKKFIGDDTIAEHAQREAESRGIDPEVAAKLIRDVTARGTKKL